MQFSYNWLSDYVDTDSPEEAAAALTGAGLSVELIEERKVASGEIDHILEIEVTTNRPDAMNHFGLAREISVVRGRQLRWPKDGIAGDPASALSTGAKVLVEASDLCPRFTARVIENVTVAPSPQWMADRLESIGVRPINNVVDITNYLLWEWGQPQHAYDLDTLAEHTIVVRRALAGETVVTLDGTKRQLSEGMCLICDAKAPIGVAGVMGGLDTEVTEKTSRILLESAWFDPLSVRQTARRLGMHTDASHRFERGADYGNALRANDRACQLLTEYAGGTVRQGSIDVCTQEFLLQPKPIEVSPSAMVAFAGADINTKKASGWLRGLGFELEEDGPDLWSVTPPTWRVHDVELRADIYEEAMRIFGFDNIPAILPAMRGADAPESAAQSLRRLVKEHMVASGFAEAVNWAFHSQELDQIFPHLVEGGGKDGEGIRLSNPLSELYSVMRRSMLPGLVESAIFNQRRGAEAVRLFEVGHIFGNEEKEALGFIAGGQLSSPWQGRRAYDLFDLKGVFESLTHTVRLAFEVRAGMVRGLVEGTSAEIWVETGSGQRVVGHFGQLDRDDLSHPLFALEVLTDALGGNGVLVEATRTIEAPSRFPGIDADLTLTHLVEVPWSEIKASIEDLRCQGLVPHLLDYELIDRYQGKGVVSGAVNSTITFRYGSTERSLTQEEVNQQDHDLSDSLQKMFGIG